MTRILLKTDIFCFNYVKKIVKITAKKKKNAGSNVDSSFCRKFNGFFISENYTDIEVFFFLFKFKFIILERISVSLFLKI